MGSVAAIMPLIALFLVAWFWMGPAFLSAADSRQLSFTPAPPNNPLKGFMPFSGDYAAFPYSMEYFNLPLNSVMTGSNQFNWAALEERLAPIVARGNQAEFRFYLDYPALPSGIPRYLLDAGLVTHAYNDYGNNGLSVSPDYENPSLRAALTNFIAAFGAHYDGDPRIGFITVGLLGFWGEWHTYPYSWFASVTVQDEVLNAFQAAFIGTKLLVRLPYGTNPGSRPIGYHDDSFAFSTLDPPSWCFLGQLKSTGETNKWRSQPIGGEVRPEIQNCVFDPDPTICLGLGMQDYNRCVDLTHASWMVYQGAFAGAGFSGPENDLALAGARRLGYEFFVTTVTLAPLAETARVTLALRNTGVAPFYYDWPIELAALLDNGQIVQTWSPPWTLKGILPAVTNTLWNYEIPRVQVPKGVFVLAVRAVNPLPNGKPLQFANTTQNQHRLGWLTLGRFQVDGPRLGADLQSDGSVKLSAQGALPLGAIVETSPDLWTWSGFQTNLGVTNWSQTIPKASVTNAAFFRLSLPLL